MVALNPAPSTSELYVNLNTAIVLGGLAGQMKMLIYSFFVTEGYGRQARGARGRRPRGGVREKPSTRRSCPG